MLSKNNNKQILVTIILFSAVMTIVLLLFSFNFSKSQSPVAVVKYGLDFKLDYETGDVVIKRLKMNLNETEPGKIEKGLEF